MLLKKVVERPAKILHAFSIPARRQSACPAKLIKPFDKKQLLAQTDRRFHQIVPKELKMLVNKVNITQVQQKSEFESLVLSVAQALSIKPNTPDQQQQLVSLTSSLRGLDTMFRLHGLIGRSQAETYGGKALSDKKIVIGGDLFMKTALLQSSKASLQVAHAVSKIMQLECLAKYYKGPGNEHLVEDLQIQTLQIVIQVVSAIVGSEKVGQDAKDLARYLQIRNWLGFLKEESHLILQCMEHNSFPPRFFFMRLLLQGKQVSGNWVQNCRLLQTKVHQLRQASQQLEHRLTQQGDSGLAECMYGLRIESE